MIRLLLLMAFASFLAAPPAHADCPLPNEGLTGHWMLDETAGGTLDDAISTNNGAWTDGVNNSVAEETRAGKVGTALEFDGTNDKVAMPANAALRPVNLSVSVWFKADGLSASQHLVSTLQTGGYGILLSDSANCAANSLSFIVHPAAYHCINYATSNLSTTEWYHAAGTYDGDTMRLYVNGLEVGTNTTPAGNITYSGNNIVCLSQESGGSQCDDGSPFNGQMDDVRIYNRALSAAEIAGLYSQRSTADAPAGYMIYDPRHARMMYCNGTDWVHAGIGGYNPNAVNFDGTNDYLTRGADLTGNADSGKFTANFWFKVTDNAANKHIVVNATPRFDIRFTATETLQIVGSNPSGTSVLSVATTPTYADGNWHHALVSIDMASTSTRHIYIDGAAPAVTWTTYTAASTLDFTDTNHAVGALTGGTEKFTGDLADVWVDLGTYIDLSQSANRAKFRSANGLPMYLGADGSLPTGSEPDIFLSGNTASWHTNKGAGGGFTLTGALTTAATQPADTALVQGADAYCFGSDGSSQLGNGAGTSSNTQPTTVVAGGHKWTQLGRGGHQTFCALNSNADAYCWGRGLEGQIGDGNSTTRHSPTLVTGGHKWKEIANGWNTSCGIKDNGAAYCWGSDSNGQLGNGAAGASNSPSLVSGGFTWDYIEVGDEHTCAIRDNGAAYCWGQNNGGQLGCGACGGSAASPQLVLGSPTGTKWTQIGGGWQLSCGLRDDGTAWCWGTDDQGELGNGAGGSSNVPVAVAGGHTFVQLSGGGDSACGLKADGTAYCWGDDSAGQQGNGSGVNDQASPGLVQGGYSWRRIEAGSSFTCGITTAGDAYCWGSDWVGELGNGGPTADQHLPTLVLGGYKWSDIAPMHVFDGSATCGIVEYGCPSPSGVKGQMLYNSDYNVMQYCNGSEWVAMGPVGGTPSTTGLVGHWKLDESGNTNIAVDSSASANNGTLTAFPADESANWTAGKVGNGLTFDGSDDFVGIGDQSELDITGDVTVAGWVKTTDDHAAIFNKFKFTQNKGYILGLNNAAGLRLIFTIGIGTGIRAAEKDFTALSNDQWHHVAGVKNSTNPLRLYIDGVEVSSYDGQNNGAAIASPAGWSAKIGQRSDTNEGADQFNGSVDDVRVYNRALTAQEVSQLYYFGLSGGIGDVSANCSNPSLPEGAMFYNIDHNFMQYCNGERWIGIGK